MVITSIQQQKKDPLRVSIFLDDEFAFGLDSKFLVDFNLHKGTKLSEEDIREIVRKDVGSKVKARVMKLIASRPRSVREVTDYIYKKLREGKYDIEKEYWDELITGVVSELKEFDLLNDVAFAKWFVENRTNFKPRGQRLLKSELIQKGISNEIISQVLSEVGSELELEMANKLAEKKIRTLSRFSEKKRKEKLIAFLQRKGFSWDVIKTVIQESRETGKQ